MSLMQPLKVASKMLYETIVVSLFAHYLTSALFCISTRGSQSKAHLFCVLLHEFSRTKILLSLSRDQPVFLPMTREAEEQEGALKRGWIYDNIHVL